MSFGESAASADSGVMGQRDLATQGPTTLTDDEVKIVFGQAQHNATIAYQTVMAQTGNPDEAKRAAMQAAGQGLQGNISTDMIATAAEQGIVQAENPMNATPGQATGAGRAVSADSGQGQGGGVGSFIASLFSGAVGMFALGHANQEIGGKLTPEDDIASRATGYEMLAGGNVLAFNDFASVNPHARATGLEPALEEGIAATRALPARGMAPQVAGRDSGMVRQLT